MCGVEEQLVCDTRIELVRVVSSPGPMVSSGDEGDTGTNVSNSDLYQTCNDNTDVESPISDLPFEKGV